MSPDERTEIVPTESATPAAQEPARKTAERQEHEPDPIKPGSWVWVKAPANIQTDEDGDESELEEEKEKEPDWLACVVHIGSNYAKVQAPDGRSRRIHLERFDEETRPEPNASAVIAERVAERHKKVHGLLAEVKEVCARLGVSPVPSASPAAGGNYALARLSGETDIKAYEKALVKAKKEELPELFEQIKQENAELATWMSAELLPLKATAERAKDAIGYVEDRIFNVSLYAGLTEDVVMFANGEPAPPYSKLHVFQARLYMDEESLLGYQHGGLEFKDIKAYDRWMAKPKNRDRLLPYPRSLIAMKVRRNPKHRTAHDLQTHWINMDLAKLDETTFFYMRNGDRLYRMNCDFEFGEDIFPAKDEFLSEPTMARVAVGHNGGADKVLAFMTVREYESILDAEEKDRAARAAWFKANPYKKWKKAKYAEIEKQYEASIAKAQAKRDETIEKARVDGPRIRRDQERRYERTGRWRHKPTFDPARHLERVTEQADETLERMVKEIKHTRKWNRERNCDEDDWERANPHRDHHTENDGWKPFDKGNVHYDECLKRVHDQVKHWNRIALIIQGLYDRSDVFHPHPPVTLSTPEGFAAALELVYDGEGSKVLEPGPKPDFEAYRLEGLAHLETGSVTIGQKMVWLDREREQEMLRRRRSHRYGDRDRDVGSWWTPSWDHGPGYVAVIAKWRASDRTATFKWLQGRRGHYTVGDKLFRASITVPENELFNVSAYKAGDYLTFFNDRRTRRNYLRWAPLLLTAEEYLAGNVKAQAPVTEVRAKTKADEDEDSFEDTDVALGAQASADEDDGDDDEED